MPTGGMSRKPTVAISGMPTINVLPGVPYDERDLDVSLAYIASCGVSGCKWVFPKIGDTNRVP